MVGVSALRFTPIGETFDTCCGDDCNRKGRYAILLAGYPLLSDSPYATRHSRLVICAFCRKKWRGMWAEFSGANEREEVEQALEALRGSLVERVDGIDALAQLGFPPAQIAAEVKRVATEREMAAAA